MSAASQNSFEYNGATYYYGHVTFGNYKGQYTDILQPGGTYLASIRGRLSADEIIVRMPMLLADYDAHQSKLTRLR